MPRLLRCTRSHGRVPRPRAWSWPRSWSRSLFQRSFACLAHHLKDKFRREAVEIARLRPRRQTLSRTLFFLTHSRTRQSSRDLWDPCPVRDISVGRRGSPFVAFVADPSIRASRESGETLARRSAGDRRDTGKRWMDGWMDGWIGWSDGWIHQRRRRSTIARTHFAPCFATTWILLSVRIYAPRRTSKERKGKERKGKESERESEREKGKGKEGNKKKEREKAGRRTHARARAHTHTRERTSGDTERSLRASDEIGI